MQDQRLDAGQTGDRQRGEVTVAPVSAQQRRGAPQGQVRFFGYGEVGGGGVQRPYLSAAGFGGVQRQFGRFGHFRGREWGLGSYNWTVVPDWRRSIGVPVRPFSPRRLAVDCWPRSLSMSSWIWMMRSGLTVRT